MLAGTSRILTKPLFFNDLFAPFLDASRQKERSSTVYDVPVRRYSRVTYAGAVTVAAISPSRPAIPCKHLPIFSLPMRDSTI